MHLIMSLFYDLQNKYQVICIMKEKELEVFLEKYTLDYMQKCPHRRKLELEEFIAGKYLNEKAEELVKEKMKWLDYYITSNKKEADKYYQHKPINRGGFGNDLMDHFPLGGFR